MGNYDSHRFKLRGVHLASCIRGNRFTAALGHPQTGSESYGGPVITENGLLFIAGTKDGYFRAYNRFTGELLLEHKLPAPAFATPAVYEVNGRQYIAVACGGEKLNTHYGKHVVAFALPE